MLAELAAAAVLWAAPPPPSPMPVVHREACPDIAWAPCYYGGYRNEVYWPKGLNRFMLEHEMGHAFDELQINDGERRRIVRVMSWGVWRPERFADWYAACRVGMTPDWDDSRVYRPFRSVGRVAARCRLIGRAG